MRLKNIDYGYTGVQIYDVKRCRLTNNGSLSVLRLSDCTKDFDFQRNYFAIHILLQMKKTQKDTLRNAEAQER